MIDSVQDECNFQVKIPHLISKVLGYDVIMSQHFSDELKRTCNITILSITIKQNKSYWITAKGKRSYIFDLKKLLAMWDFNLHLFQCKRNNLFVEGSYLSVFEECVSDTDTAISFIPYQGKSQPKHIDSCITKSLPIISAIASSQFHLYPIMTQLQNQLQKAIA